MSRDLDVVTISGTEYDDLRRAEEQLNPDAVVVSKSELAALDRVRYEAEQFRDQLLELGHGLFHEGLDRALVALDSIRDKKDVPA
jgi:hypothetical protein